jgi:hypothetical protein
MEIVRQENPRANRSQGLSDRTKDNGDRNKKRTARANRTVDLRYE